MEQKILTPNAGRLYTLKDQIIAWVNAENIDGNILSTHTRKTFSQSFVDYTNNTRTRGPAANLHNRLKEFDIESVKDNHQDDMKASEITTRGMDDSENYREDDPYAHSKILGTDDVIKCDQIRNILVKYHFFPPVQHKLSDATVGEFTSELFKYVNNDNKGTFPNL